MNTPQPPIDDELFYEAVAATAELSGSKLSAKAAQMLAADLAGFPREQIMAALRRCRREGVKRLTVSEVIGRIDDGRPAPDEAWTMLPKDAAGSVVWCEEMQSAERMAMALIERGDWRGAYVVFKEGYARIVEDARNAGVAPVWSLRQGSDADALERALRTGIAHGRVTAAFAKSVCPHIGMKSVPIYPLAMGIVPLHAATPETDDDEDD